MAFFVLRDSVVLFLIERMFVFFKLWGIVFFYS